MKTALLLAPLALSAGCFAARPDFRIRGGVRSALKRHTSVSGLRTTVDASGGVVTLRGTADYGAQKDLASEYAAEVQGVKGVVNLMTVR